MEKLKKKNTVNPENENHEYQENIFLRIEKDFCTKEKTRQTVIGNLLEFPKPARRQACAGSDITHDTKIIG